MANSWASTEDYLAALKEAYAKHEEKAAKVGSLDQLHPMGGIDLKSDPEGLFQKVYEQKYVVGIDYAGAEKHSYQAYDSKWHIYDTVVERVIDDLPENWEFFDLQHFDITDEGLVQMDLLVADENGNEMKVGAVAGTQEALIELLVEGVYALFRPPENNHFNQLLNLYT